MFTTASSLHVPRQIMFWLNNSEQFVPVYQLNIVCEPKLKDQGQDSYPQCLDHSFGT